MYMKEWRWPLPSSKFINFIYSTEQTNKRSWILNQIVKTKKMIHIFLTQGSLLSLFSLSQGPFLRFCYAWAIFVSVSYI